MFKEKRITMDQTLWDRLDAVMKREGFATTNEAVRHCVRKEVQHLEARAKEEGK